MILLYIDDDPEDVELFQDAVERIDNSFKCVSAANGLEAMEVLNTITPDYIFLDVNMPIMDGRETLVRIRGVQRLNAIPVFILSTSDGKWESEWFRRVGATKWLVKPSTFPELIARLRSVIA